MSAMSNYLEQKIADHVMNKVAYTSPDTYLALYTAAPGETGGGTEVSGGSYARELCDENGGSSPTWDLAVSNGSGGYLVDNGADITFTQATGDWGTVTDMAIHDAVTAGNMLLYATLSASKTVNSGDTFKFPTGEVDIEFK